MSKFHQSLMFIAFSKSIFKQSVISYAPIAALALSTAIVACDLNRSRNIKNSIAKANQCSSNIKYIPLSEPQSKMAILCNMSKLFLILCIMTKNDTIKKFHPWRETIFLLSANAGLCFNDGTMFLVFPLIMLRNYFPLTTAYICTLSTLVMALELISVRTIYSYIQDREDQVTTIGRILACGSQAPNQVEVKSIEEKCYIRCDTLTGYGLFDEDHSKVRDMQDGELLLFCPSASSVRCYNKTTNTNTAVAKLVTHKTTTDANPMPTYTAYDVGGTCIGDFNYRGRDITKLSGPSI